MKEIVSKFLTREGNATGKAKLSLAAGKSLETIRRWTVKGFPTAHDVYTVAKACGCSDEEALSLARECFPDGQRKAG